jgi:hypothetical protein
VSPHTDGGLWQSAGLDWTGLERAASEVLTHAIHTSQEAHSNIPVKFALECTVAGWNKVGGGRGIGTEWAWAWGLLLVESSMFAVVCVRNRRCIGGRYV